MIASEYINAKSIIQVGYCDLYTLQKEDLWDALHEYPHAMQSLMEKGGYGRIR